MFQLYLKILINNNTEYIKIKFKEIELNSNKF